MIRTNTHLKFWQLSLFESRFPPPVDILHIDINVHVAGTRVRGVSARVRSRETFDRRKTGIGSKVEAA